MDHRSDDEMKESYHRARRASSRHGVNPAKAKEILRDGTAQGHPLTARQKRYFGFLAGGGPRSSRRRGSRRSSRPSY